MHAGGPFYALTESFAVQICMDPYFRTIAGFCLLIEKEWMAFGASSHAFPLIRSVHLTPLFMQHINGANSTRTSISPSSTIICLSSSSMRVRCLSSCSSFRHLELIDYPQSLSVATVEPKPGRVRVQRFLPPLPSRIPLQRPLRLFPCR